MPGSCTLLRAFSSDAALNGSTASGFTWTKTWTISMVVTLKVSGRRKPWQGHDLRVSCRSVIPW
jgi:hypothetical protein